MDVDIIRIEGVRRSRHVNWRYLLSRCVSTQHSARIIRTFPVAEVGAVMQHGQTRVHRRAHSDLRSPAA